MRGEVVAFDEHAGLGAVRADDGAVLFLHCTALADGSRSVDVGAAVCFAVVPGHRGVWEAARVEKL